MKSIIWIQVCVVCLWGAVASAQVVERVGQSGSIDWTASVIRAEGVGFAEPDPLEPTSALERKARSAAKSDALRNLLETAGAVRVTGATDVNQLMAQDDEVRLTVQGFVRGARVVSHEKGREDNGDIMYKVVMEAPLSAEGGFADQLLPFVAPEIIKTPDPREIVAANNGSRVISNDGKPPRKEFVEPVTPHSERLANAENGQDGHGDARHEGDHHGDAQHGDAHHGAGAAHGDGAHREGPGGDPNGDNTPLQDPHVAVTDPPEHVDGSAKPPKVAAGQAPTGVVIDARNYELRPALFPQLISEDNRSLLSPLQLRRVARANRASIFHSDPKLGSSHPRVAATPLTAAAKGADGSTVVVANDVADRIQEADSKHSVLKQGKLLFVIKPMTTSEKD